MKQTELQQLIEALIRGDISPDEHGLLQEQLKSNSDARELFRERMDLEASLRTWAAEIPVESIVTKSPQTTATASKSFLGSAMFALGIAAIATALLITVSRLWKPENSGDLNTTIVEQDQPPPKEESPQFQSIGIVREQPGCEWENLTTTSAGSFSLGEFKLIRGVAELIFNSGTEVILEAPCELTVMSRDSARLKTGQLFVNVTELSNGFTLETPEAQIVDEGTEYAVALNEVSTEVHVFDGSVIWIPELGEKGSEDRIPAGEARRYSRAAPSQREHIPFGRRQFVRRIEFELQEQAGDTLLAYDGFENLVGRIRTGRSGFGWSGGWQPGRRGRGGKLGEILDAPDDIVFGFPRQGRRLLQLAQGDNLTREFESPLNPTSGQTYYVGCFIERVAGDAVGSQSFLISLEPAIGAGRRGHRRTRSLSFGISPDGFPFINSGNVIEETASRFHNEETCFCVFKLAATERGAVPRMRLYHSDERIDSHEPKTWTVTGNTSSITTEVTSLRLTAGTNAVWRIDELKIGTTWQSVIPSPSTE